MNYSFCSSMKYGKNLVPSLAFAYNISAETLLTFHYFERNYKKLNVLHFGKMWIKVCHLETGKSGIWTGIFL